jgi:hypothetical protein
MQWPSKPTRLCASGRSSLMYAASALLYYLFYCRVCMLICACMHACINTFIHFCYIPSSLLPTECCHEEGIHQIQRARAVDGAFVDSVDGARGADVQAIGRRSQTGT